MFLYSNLSPFETLERLATDVVILLVGMRNRCWPTMPDGNVVAHVASHTEIRP